MPTTNTQTPLISLDAVVLDTETTGPDAARARIIQVGAVRIAKGRLDGGAPLDILIDPREPIPASSTQIHGITDADVAGAPTFEAAVGKVAGFVKNAVVIGHAIGYDLMALKSESERAGLDWKRPRSLDTRMLARICRPTMIDYSLDTVAGWFGVEIVGRHTALGDAQATAEVFLGLLPALREHGIRTLGEAERACRAFSDEFEQHRRIGWVEPVVPHGEVEDTLRPLARIDSYPYRHRVRDVMSAPPVFVKPGTMVHDAVAVMVEKNISSVFVRPRRKGGEVGIVTERDALRALAARKGGGTEPTVADIMSTPLQTVREDAFVYRAIGRMTRLGFRHLGVVDDHGEVAGALTTRDLLKQRAEDAITLGDEIEEAHDAGALGVAWARLPVVAHGLLSEGVDPRDVAAVISRELCAFTRRSVEIALVQMREAGRGEPPVPFAVLVMGSGGRGESTLKPDQDNAIVYARGKAGGKADKWLQELGERFSDILHEVGIPYCNGGVMARNAEWRHSLADWKKVVDGWLRHAEPKDINYVDIFYDFTAVYGDIRLAAELFEHAYRRAHGAPGFQKLLAVQATDFRPPLTLFGRLKTGTAGRVDVKAGGLLPIVAGARLLAIRHDVHRRSTLERLIGVRDKGVGAASDFDHVIDAHELLLRRLLEQQLDDIEKGAPPSNKVDIRRLSKDDRKALAEALKAVNIMNTLVGDPMAMG